MHHIEQKKKTKRLGRGKQLTLMEEIHCLHKALSHFTKSVTSRSDITNLNK